MCSAKLPPVPLGFRRTLILPSSPSTTRSLIASSAFRSAFAQRGVRFGDRGCKRRQLPVLMAFSFDDDSVGMSTLMDESNEAYGEDSSYVVSSGDSVGMSTLMDESNEAYGEDSSYVVSSGDEDSDTDLVLPPVVDVELTSGKERFHTAESESLTVATHRFANLHGRIKRRTHEGILISLTLGVFVLAFLLFFDWCSWRIVRMPLEPFFLTHPFTLSAALSVFAGFLFVPIVDVMQIHQIPRKEVPPSHLSKRGTPSMGGLFFIPVAIAVASTNAGENCTAIFGAAMGTVAFAVIGLLDDILNCLKNRNYGLPGWAKLGLQVVVGAWFSFWLDSTHMSTPYNMKFLVPLPPPLGIVYLGKFYLALTAFSFTSMSNGVNLTDGLDGLAGGCAALAFIGMSVAVLAICPDLAVFGASMSGACIGFLFHNRYKASIFMGDTGSLALGGALAAMAALSGMFFPLFICSGTFVVEVLSVILQVSYKGATKILYGTRRRIFRMAPIHHHFELCGIKEPLIVAGAYVLSLVLAILAGYVGLISA